MSLGSTASSHSGKITVRKGKEGHKYLCDYKEAKMGISLPVREDRSPARLIGNCRAWI